MVAPALSPERLFYTDVHLRQGANAYLSISYNELNFIKAVRATIPMQHMSDRDIHDVFVDCSSHDYLPCVDKDRLLPAPQILVSRGLERAGNLVTDRR